MAFTFSSYSSVVYLTTDFGQGSGVIIGAHTILTASHMVWSQDARRTTGSFSVSGGAASPVSPIKVSIADGAATLHYNQIDDAAGTISTFASQRDYAVINVSADLSAYAPMAISPAFSTGSVHITGYPSTAAGRQTDNTAFARSSSFFETISFTDADVTHGNSGGPLWTTIDGRQTVVGIVSAGSRSSATAARIGADTYNDIVRWTNEANGQFAQPVAATPVGRPSANTGFSNYFGSTGVDALTGSDRNDFLFGSGGDDAINAKGGFDVVVYDAAPISDFSVAVDAGVVSVKKSVLGGTDALTGVERIRFADAVIAFDASGDLGQAYRLYQAAFNRTPDRGGLSYWVKYLDDGGALHQAATNFIGSAEFKATYGDNPGPRQIVEAMYRNVLGRDGEAGGVEFWVTAVTTRVSTADLLQYFSESPENVARVAGVLSNGVTLDLI